MSSRARGMITITLRRTGNEKLISLTCGTGPKLFVTFHFVTMICFTYINRAKDSKKQCRRTVSLTIDIVKKRNSFEAFLSDREAFELLMTP